MTIPPLSGNPGPQALAPQTRGGALSAGANAETLPDETRADAALQARIGLDEREQAYRGIVSSDSPRAEWQGKEPPPFADKAVSDMTDAELHQLFGDQADRIKQIGQRQPGLTGTQVLPLARDAAELETVQGMLESRPDLNWSDLVKVGADGKTRVDPSVTDGTSRELLLNRQDVKPIELTQMAASFHAELRDPGLAEAARKKALNLLRERPDVKPQELTGLMQTLVRGQNGNAGQSAAAALDMFDSSARLLTARRDLGVQDANKLASGVLGMAGKKDDKSGFRSSMAMSEAVDTLIVRQDMNAEGIVQLTHTMNQKFPGQDEGSAGDRHSAFSKGLSLMRQVPGMDAGTIGTMMQKASDGPPPRKGVRLLQAFDTMSHGVLAGRANMELMRDPLANADPRGERRRDGEIVLDKYGNEKGDAQNRPTLAAHQAPFGSQVEPEKPGGPAADKQEPTGQAGQAPGAPAEDGANRPPDAGADLGQDPQRQRQQG